MMNRIWLSTVSVGIAVTALVIAGCGGGGGAGPEPTTTGTVTGTVGALGEIEDIIEGVEGAVVSIGARTGTTDSTGQFAVDGVSAGLQQLITVVPPDGYVLVNSQPIRSDVKAGRTEKLPRPILVTRGYPPPPWSPD